jgi:hypothetical protein
MGAIEATVRKAARLCSVKRRVAGAYGADGRFDAGAETINSVRLHIQPTSASTLQRGELGDKSGGDIDVWASLTDLAAAYLTSDLSETALSWTSLNVAPPEGESGPRGDYVTWNGRVYEIVRYHDHVDGGLISDARIQRYSAADRGAA